MIFCPFPLVFALAYGGRLGDAKVPKNRINSAVLRLLNPLVNPLAVIVLLYQWECVKASPFVIIDTMADYKMKLDT